MVSNLYGRLNLILVRANARSLLLRDISSRREIHVHVVPKHNFVVNLFISYILHVSSMVTALCGWTKGSIIRQYRKPKKLIAARCAMASLKWRFLIELYLVHFTIKYLLIPPIKLVYRRSRDYTICALFISQSLITRSQFIYGYRKGEGVLHADNTKHRQILRNVSMPHCQLFTFRYTETPFRSSHTFFSPHNKGFCFSMNNAVLVALFGHIA